MNSKSSTSFDGKNKNLEYIEIIYFLFEIKTAKTLTIISKCLSGQLLCIIQNWKDFKIFLSSFDI